MVLNAKIIVFLRTQTWVVRVALVVLIGIWFRVVVGDNYRTFYAMSEQLRSIPIELMAYLDCYPRKGSVDPCSSHLGLLQKSPSRRSARLLCHLRPEDRKRLSSQHRLCNQKFRDRRYSR
jgi:hypothetical protein